MLALLLWLPPFLFRLHPMRWLLPAMLALAACGKVSAPAHEGALVVGMRATPVFYQTDDDGISGYEYDLASAFARELGLKLKIIRAADSDELLKLLRQGRIHMATSLPLDDGQNDVLYTTPLRDAGYVVVQHADGLPISELADLTGREVYLADNSPVFASMNELPTALRPTLKPLDKVDDVRLLGQLAEKKIPLAATDTLHFAIAANFYPELRSGVELPGRLRLAWGASLKDTALHEKATQFIEQARADGTLARIEDRYFGHIRRLNEVGVSRFIADIRTVLPDLRPHFQQAQEQTGIDWRLLAALAYQESKWNPLATSFTGVRGLMMLTEDTADHLGVKNRLDPYESIMAGSRYLADLADDLPEEAKEPDRMWLALAAYNLGMGHLNGGRHLAKGLKADPNSWYEMKRVLPMLARPEIYARMKSGKARGGEAVIMVENIRTYYDILSRFEAAHKPVIDGQR